MRARALQITDDRVFHREEVTSRLKGHWSDRDVHHNSPTCNLHRGVEYFENVSEEPYGPRNVYRHTREQLSMHLFVARPESSSRVPYDSLLSTPSSNDGKIVIIANRPGKCATITDDGRARHEAIDECAAAASRVVLLSALGLLDLSKRLERFQIHAPTVTLLPSCNLVANGAAGNLAGKCRTIVRGIRHGVRRCTKNSARVATRFT